MLGVQSPTNPLTRDPFKAQHSTRAPSPYTGPRAAPVAPSKPLPPPPRQSTGNPSQPLPTMTKVLPPVPAITKAQAKGGAVLAPAPVSVAKPPVTVQPDPRQIAVTSAFAAAKVRPTPAPKRIDFIDAEMERFAKANELAGQMMHLALLLENDPQFDTVIEEFNKSLKTAVDATDYFTLELWSADPKSQPLSSVQYKETLERVLKVLQNDWSGAGLVEPLLSITFDISVYYVLSAKGADKLNLSNGIDELIENIINQAENLAKDHENTELHDYIASRIKSLKSLIFGISDYFQPDFWCKKNWNSVTEEKFKKYLDSFSKSNDRHYLCSTLVIHAIVTNFLNSKNLQNLQIFNIADFIYKNNTFGPITKRCLSIYAIRILILTYFQVDEVKKKIITESVCNIVKNSDSPTLKKVEARFLKYQQ